MTKYITSALPAAGIIPSAAGTARSIDALLPDIRLALANHTRCILQAPPGSGKTTRVPPALLDSPWLGDKKILILEPRRLAARTAARYMSRLFGEEIGGL